MKFNSSITAIILAGGKSNRMGKDKPFLLFSGRPLIEIMVNKLSLLFENLIIVTNRPRLYPVRKLLSNGVYKKYKIKTKVDVFKNCGPLGGIYTGLSSSKNQYNFIVACDMPFLNLDLVRYMIEKAKSYDVVIPEYNNRFQPLYAIYSKRCITPIKTQRCKNNLRIIDFFNHVKVRTITTEEIAKFDAEGLCFANINTPKDYRLLKR